MQNKRGWIKIVEAFLALMIITIVLLSAYSVTKQENTSSVYRIEDSVLDSIVQDSVMREAVLHSDVAAVNGTVAGKLSSVFGFEVLICNPEDICNLPAYKKDVYARERIVSSTLDEYSPKKLKLFVWEK